MTFNVLTKYIWWSRCDILVNLSLGFISFNLATAEYKYFHTRKQCSCLFSPTPQDFDRFVARLRDVDFLEPTAASRPASSWVVHRVMNVTVCEYPYSASPNRPHTCKSTTQWSKEQYKHNMILMHDSKGVPYRNNLCLFRCIGRDRTGSLNSSITARAKDLTTSVTCS